MNLWGGPEVDGFHSEGVEGSQAGPGDVSQKETWQVNLRDGLICGKSSGIERFRYVVKSLTCHGVFARHLPAGTRGNPLHASVSNAKVG